MSSARREAFLRDGYVVLPSLIGGPDVDSLRVLYDAFMSGEIDSGPDLRMLGGITPQAINCRMHAAELREHPVVAAARAAASELLDCNEPDFFFDMMIYKPPGHPEPTPWHQDLSYYERPYSQPGRMNPMGTTQFWVALDDADVENGCMHFVPGHHDKPMLEHYIASGDPDDEGRLLAVKDESQLDLDAAVACPLRAGGATVHLEGTPHYTPPNSSADRPRRAYIMTWRNPALVVL